MTTQKLQAGSSTAHAQRTVLPNLRAQSPGMVGRPPLRLPPLVLLALSIMLLFVFCALFAPWLAPHDPVVNNLRGRLSAPVALGGDLGFILGSDALGTCSVV
jgi:peptide/nickel transport system permease protein